MQFLEEKLLKRLSAWTNSFQEELDLLLDELEQSSPKVLNSHSGCQWRTVFSFIHFMSQATQKLNCLQQHLKRIFSDPFWDKPTVLRFNSLFSLVLSDEAHGSTCMAVEKYNFLWCGYLYIQFLSISAIDKLRCKPKNTLDIVCMVPVFHYSR